MTDKPSAGALRAAHWWLDDSVTDEHEINALAVCIDKETGLGELIEAASNMVREWRLIVGDEENNSTPGDTLERLVAVLAHIQGKD